MTLLPSAVPTTTDRESASGFRDFGTIGDRAYFSWVLEREAERARRNAQ